LLLKERQRTTIVRENLRSRISNRSRTLRFRSAGF
jgi:hypothetical protein